MTITKLLTSSFNSYKTVTNQLNELSQSVPQLFLRLILAWEFGESGFEKLHGVNWFADLTFPFLLTYFPLTLAGQSQHFLKL